MEKQIIESVLVLLSIYVVIWGGLYLIFARLLYSAKSAGLQISLLQLVLLHFRKIPPALIVKNLIAAKKAGLELDRSLLEVHQLAGGNVDEVVKALIKAKETGVVIDFRTASAIDLAGKNVLQAVEKGQQKSEFTLPYLAVTTRDGIHVFVKADVEAYHSVAGLLGLEVRKDLLSARLSAALISVIGYADSAKNVLSDPGRYALEALQITDLTQTGFSNVNLKIEPSLAIRKGAE